MSSVFGFYFVELVVFFYLVVRNVFRYGFGFFGLRVENCWFIECLILRYRILRSDALDRGIRFIVKLG